MAGKQINDNRKDLGCKRYESELRWLQAELCKLQEWVKCRGLRIIVVFEGRAAAGKGGTIRAITERVSPRVFRVAALPEHKMSHLRICTPEKINTSRSFRPGKIYSEFSRSRRDRQR
jgi:Polyphosphate kinase 2 (PPK2)